MKIRSLKMKNFGPYKGEQLVLFPTDPSRRVMLVFGDNMRGKTSFLNAIRWVLYGRALDRASKEVDLVHLVNRDAQDEDDFTMSVTLAFEADGSEYELARSIEPFGVIGRPKNSTHFKKDVLLRRNGSVVKGEDIEPSVNSFIPEQVSRFYLFDGELLDEYESLLREDTVQGQAIKEAIEQILGVPALVNARDEIKHLLKSAQILQAKESKNVVTLSSYSAETLRLQEQIAAHKTDLDAEQGKLHRLAERIDAISTELEAAEPIQAVNQELASVRSQLNAVQSELADTVRTKQEVLKGAWQDLLQPRLDYRRQELTAQIERSRKDIKKEGVVEERIERLNELLNQSICPACEQPVSEERKKKLGEELGGLTAELEDLNMTSRVVTDANAELALLGKIRGTGAAARLKQLDTAREKAEIRLTSLENKRDTLQDKIDNNSVARIAQISKEKEGLLKLRGKIESAIDSIKADIEDKQNNINRLSRLMFKSPEARNQRSSREVEVYMGMDQVFARSVDALRERLRTKVEEAASDVFLHLTTESTYTGLRINSNYGLTILDRKGDEVTIRSAGAEQIVAMSLLSALNRTVNRPGPIIVDTPFGRLDPKHRANILKFVPNMGEQIVFLVHEGEINRGTGLDGIAAHVGITYDIQRVSSSHSEIKRTGE